MELAIIALVVPFGLGLTFHKRMSEKLGSSNVAKVTELSPPSSPRQQAQSDAPGAPLIQSYEADWAKLECPELATPVFNLAKQGRGSGRRESALAVLKHRQELALHDGNKALAKNLERERQRLETALPEDDVWTIDWAKIDAAAA